MRMKYGYSLFLLLGAYLLYHPGISPSTLALLYWFLVFAALGGVVEFLSVDASFRAWLHQWF